MPEQLFEIGGKKYRCSMLGARFVHREVENQLMKRYRERFAELSDGIQDGPLFRAIQKAVDGVLRTGFLTEDVFSFLYSIDGVGYAFWMAVRDLQDLTLDDCEKLVDVLPRDEISRLRDIVDYMQGIVLNPTNAPIPAQGNGTSTGIESNEVSGTTITGLRATQSA